MKYHHNFTHFRSINPANNLIIREFNFCKKQEVQESLQKVKNGYLINSKLTFEERSQKVLKFADMLKQLTNPIAQNITQEMGKPILQAKEEISKAIEHCQFFAKHSKDFLSSEEVELNNQQKCEITPTPLGPILCNRIMPWNFPIWLPIKFGIPNIMAGNSILLKHSPTVPCCSIILEELFKKSGFNSGEYVNAFLDYSQIESIILGNHVEGVALTGSSEAGKQIAQISGKAIKKCVLELGGNDPFIVLKDANISKAAELAVKGRMKNAGQVCNAPKRFIVHSSIYSDFLNELKEQMKAFKIGDPMEAEFNIGPIARMDLLKKLKFQTQKMLKNGGKIEYGVFSQDDEVPPVGSGNYFEPLIFSNLDSSSFVHKEEIFGPIIPIFKFEKEAEAISMANSTPYGLGGVIFTENPQSAYEMAIQLDAGMVAINNLVSSSSMAPAGGIKQSGFGRECGKEGIREFINLKSIVFSE